MSQAEAWAGSGAFDDKLIVVVANSGADRPAPDLEKVFNVGSEFAIITPAHERDCAGCAGVEERRVCDVVTELLVQARVIQFHAGLQIVNAVTDGQARVSVSLTETADLIGDVSGVESRFESSAAEVSRNIIRKIREDIGFPIKCW